MENNVIIRNPEAKRFTEVNFFYGFIRKLSESFYDVILKVSRFFDNIDVIDEKFRKDARKHREKRWHEAL